MDNTNDDIYEFTGDDDDPENHLDIMARIPTFAGDDKKLEYLAYRAIGFPVMQALELVGESKRTLDSWRNKTPGFENFERDNIRELQQTTAKDILSLKFKRNMFLLMEQDFKVIEASAGGLDELSDREWQWLRDIRKHYTPGDFRALEQALNPEEHNSPTVINLTWNTGAPRIVEHNPPESVEGHFQVLPSDGLPKLNDGMGDANNSPTLSDSISDLPETRDDDAIERSN